MYVFSNPNPSGQFVGDCVIRAISIATNQSWDATFIRIALQGYAEKNMPSANRVWGNYLRQIGYKKSSIDDGCTVAEFAERHPHGTYILGTGSHVVTIIDGNYFDAYDSGQEKPLYFFRR